MTIDLHFICPHGDKWTNLGNNKFETGNWTMGQQAADESIGGRIYLHEHQRDVAWHGGKIIAWRPSDEAGRVIFTYQVDGPFRVRCTESWAQEKAIVRHPS